MKNKALSSALILLFLAAVFILGIFGLSSFTAPIIEENNSAAAYAPLLAVMPDAKGFEPIYEAASADSSALIDVPETVQGIYRESSGLGYALKLSTTEGYTGEPIELSFGVDAEGKICGVDISSYPDSKDFGTEYPLSFIGQDSALGDVGLVAGVTFSSSAFKNAVADGFAALTANSLVSEGVKSDEQLLMELASGLYSGIVNPSGSLQYEELEAPGSILQAFLTGNGGGYAAIVPYNEGSALVIVNLSGDVMAFDTEGSIVTDKLDGAIIEEVKAEALNKLSSFEDKDLKRLSRMLPEGAEFTALPIDGVFSTVTTAFSVSSEGQEYTAIAARSYGYSNEIMPVYCILDSEGAIYSITTPELIFHKEYFDGYTLDEAAYREGFTGLTAGSFTGGQAIISGATMSTEGMKSAVNDIFAAWTILNESEGNGNE